MKPGNVTRQRAPDTQIKETEVSRQGADENPYPISRVAEMVEYEWR